jgi:Peptidase A4 family
VGLSRVHSTSSNWSGYSAFKSRVKFTDVKGDWIQPAATCTSERTYSSFWVGIDGYNSNTVEQTGTDADCNNGSPVYYAW